MTVSPHFKTDGERPGNIVCEGASGTAVNELIATILDR
jgi:hypothetical protein